MHNKNKGITLVALVITIIILLIVAGVAISAFTQTGLFDNSKQAKNATENAQNKAEGRLNEYEKEIADYGNGKEQQDKVSAEMVSFTPEDSNWNVKNVKEALDYLYNN